MMQYFLLISQVLYQLANMHQSFLQLRSKTNFK